MEWVPPDRKAGIDILDEEGKTGFEKGISRCSSLACAN